LSPTAVSHVLKRPRLPIYCGLGKPCPQFLRIRLARSLLRNACLFLEKCQKDPPAGDISASLVEILYGRQHTEFQSAATFLVRGDVIAVLFHLRKTNAPIASRAVRRCGGRARQKSIPGFGHGQPNQIVYIRRQEFTVLPVGDKTRPGTPPTDHATPRPFFSPPDAP